MISALSVHVRRRRHLDSYVNVPGGVLAFRKTVLPTIYHLPFYPDPHSWCTTRNSLPGPIWYRR